MNLFRNCLLSLFCIMFFSCSDSDGDEFPEYPEINARGVVFEIGWNATKPSPFWIDDNYVYNDDRYDDMDGTYPNFEEWKKNRIRYYPASMRRFYSWFNEIHGTSISDNTVDFSGFDYPLGQSIVTIRRYVNQYDYICFESDYIIFFFNRTSNKNINL